ncbi:hypothetical protein ACERK3_19425 [Phycisphaerales bacterium AB-hyl4]|uniref:Uncharacterized protein n=1 Tax=Natronomicrosphaera hydrolytica TaxID=3242702 RepID=A0ABV4UC72_9BACT
MVDAAGGVPEAATTQLHLRCVHCDYQLVVQMSVPLEDLLEAVRAVHAHGPHPIEPHDQVEAHADRGVQALGPLDAAEVRTFLQQLKRLSFRRDTKNFQQWISRLNDRNTP